MLSLFLARRFFTAKGDGGADRRKSSTPAIGIATAGIALGVAVMIISVCVAKGFQHEVRGKLTGFASHIEIIDLKAFSSPESFPLVTDTALVRSVSSVSGVAHTQRFSEKLGIFKTADDFCGIALKGVAQDYDLTFVRQHVTEGKMPSFTDREASNQIVISRIIAERLGLKTGDRVFSYFFARTVKQRRFTVAAIYDTHLPQFDRAFVFTDLYTVNRLNDWASDLSSGLEVRLHSFDALPAVQSALAARFNGKTDRNGAPYYVLGISENPRTASMLSWLELLDLNVLIILVIMVVVSGFTMVSGLLILILERTRTIGVLKALGAGNRCVRHTFLWFAAFIIGRGLLIGNVLGLAIIFAQRHFGFVTLDPEIYYVDAVPVEINFWWLLGINAFSLLVTMLALVLPSFLTSKVQPAKAIQFD